MEGEAAVAREGLIAEAVASSQVRSEMFCSSIGQLNTELAITPTATPSPATQPTTTANRTMT